ncbi:hypothetical protein LZ30DRAFT_318723 [Colletotrichum cereale]|nr:hypothetical protein LZ30DRAFT_318723 [Colletotrichum cereale]
MCTTAAVHDLVAATKSAILPRPRHIVTRLLGRCWADCEETSSEQGGRRRCITRNEGRDTESKTLQSVVRFMFVSFQPLGVFPMLLLGLPSFFFAGFYTLFFSFLRQHHWARTCFFACHLSASQADPRLSETWASPLSHIVCRPLAHPRNRSSDANDGVLQTCNRRPRREATHLSTCRRWGTTPGNQVTAQARPSPYGPS